MKNKEIFREFSKYVSLNVLGMIGISCYILADTFFVAKALGADGLTALNFCISIFSILQGFGLMIGIGGGTRYAILKSNGKNREAGAVFMHALAVGTVIAALFLVIAIFFTVPLVQLLGADERTMPLARTYLTTMLCFAPFFILDNILIAFVRNDNDPKLAMTAMLVSSFSNVILDYLFMFPLSMGMFGAAFATGLSPVIGVGILLLHFRKGKSSFRLIRCRLYIREAVRILFLGISAFIGELSSAIALITFNLVILSLEGNVGVAAYGIVANIALIAVAIFTGVAQGIQPLTSREHGQGKKEVVGQIIKYAVTLSIVLALIIYGTVFLGREGLVSAFNSEGNVTLETLAIAGMIIYFVGFFFAGVNIIGAAFFSAIAKPGAALVISLMRSLIVIIPMVLGLSRIWQMEGVWLSFVFTEMFVLLVTVYFIGKWWYNNAEV